MKIRCLLRGHDWRDGPWPPLRMLSTGEYASSKRYCLRCNAQIPWPAIDALRGES